MANVPEQSPIYTNPDQMVQGKVGEGPLQPSHTIRPTLYKAWIMGGPITCQSRQPAVSRLVGVKPTALPITSSCVESLDIVSQKAVIRPWNTNPLPWNWPLLYTQHNTASTAQHSTHSRWPANREVELQGKYEDIVIHWLLLFNISESAGSSLTSWTTSNYLDPSTTLKRTVQYM